MLTLSLETFGGCFVLQLLLLIPPPTMPMAPLPIVFEFFQKDFLFDVKDVKTVDEDGVAVVDVDIDDTVVVWIDLEDDRVGVVDVVIFVVLWLVLLHLLLAATVLAIDSCEFEEAAVIVLKFTQFGTGSVWDNFGNFFQQLTQAVCDCDINPAVAVVAVAIAIATDGVVVVVVVNLLTNCFCCFFCIWRQLESFDAVDDEEFDEFDECDDCDEEGHVHSILKGVVLAVLVFVLVLLVIFFIL